MSSGLTKAQRELLAMIAFNGSAGMTKVRMCVADWRRVDALETRDLVQRLSDHAYRITPAGRAALNEPTNTTEEMP